MMLHEDREKFLDVILAVSNELKIAPALIEKDYYVTLLLKKLNEGIPGLLFKGGTSLSKCHKIIDRFSEDIDLTLDEEHFTQSKKRNANKIIIQVCDELGFYLENRSFLENHSHGNYNSYNIQYPITFKTDEVKPYVKIEMVFIHKAYPSVVKQTDSYIGSWLRNNGNENYVKNFQLIPFDMNVQSLERTFVDKVFAICDYYLRNESLRNSRHIYDISKILTNIEFNTPIIKQLIEKVRNYRKHNKTCVSAQDGIIISKILQEIIDTNFFQKDYEETTDKLLISPIHYEDAILSILKIIESKIFD